MSNDIQCLEKQTMRYLITTALICTVLAAPAEAQMTLDVSKITCDQYVHSKIATPNYIAAWMSGYYSAKRDDRVIDPQALQDNVSKLQHYCYEEKNFKVTVMQAVEQLFGTKR
jgi:acid stress chaperone HdeB